MRQVEIARVERTIQHRVGTVLLAGDEQQAATVSRGVGCDACRGSGYSGRTGVYELLVLDDAMRAAITSGEGAATVRTLARAHGMQVLRDDGARLVMEGVTTPEEVMRVCRV